MGPAVVIWVPWTWQHGTPPPGLGTPARVIFRRQDYGLTRPQAAVRLARDIGELVWRTPRQSTVVLATIGIEALPVALLLRALSGRRRRVIVFDFLAPRRQVPKRLAARLTRAVSRWDIVRRGDAAMLNRRFGVPAQRCRFIAWPVSGATLALESHEEEPGYVYAAGWAHRDWEVMSRALELSGLPAIIAPGRPVEAAPPVRVIDMPAPDRGRDLARRSTVVAVPMVDTDLPSGPLVLLDALAMGKAVVVSDVNGSRDYVRDGETALVVPPGDPEALADRLLKLFHDPPLRVRLGHAAKQAVAQHSDLSTFWQELLRPCP